MKEKLWIYLPYGLTVMEEKKWINKMIERSEKLRNKSTIASNKELQKRAKEINNQYFDGSLDFRIKLVTNQTSKFGSCTPDTKLIRISDRVISFPRWVQNYIILHELAHLIYPNHSKKFWEKVNRYKYTERARGYLIAVSKLSNNVE